MPRHDPYPLPMTTRFQAANVLCRTCSNWLGRPSGGERRRSSRACSAGHAFGGKMFECESYVGLPLSVLIPSPKARANSASR